jgi:hypothetical protein
LMIEKIYDQLQTPKTLQELHSRLNESGVNWNMAQLQLFVEIDRTILKREDKYRVDTGNAKGIILDIIDNTMEGKPMIHVKKLMEHMPAGITEFDIVKAALASGKYKRLNDAVIMKN